MKKIFILLLFCFFSCRTIYDKTNICGQYNYLHIGRYNKEVVYTLILYNDGTYSYYNNVMSHRKVMDCKSKSGKWKRKGNLILLNSYFPECLVEKIKQTEKTKDSIQIEILKLSDYTPKEGVEVIFKMNDLSYVEKYTDSNGIVVFPRKNVNKVMLGSYGISVVKPPPNNYYYRAYYEDCFHWTFNNKKFIILNDSTLIQTEVSKYYDSNKKKVKIKSEEKYNKVE
ncbi:MAG: hypothetical protein PHI52_05085 [Bacteroidales bacterium]|nr:hypothetical protein [Bacteroidales bacterium]